MCVVYLRNFQQDGWQEIGRTETINNTLNPNFVKKIHLIYRFEEQQHLKFEVYDVDTTKANLEEHDFLGYCETTLGQVVSSGELTMPLLGISYNKGELSVTAEELAVCRDEVILQFSGHKLDSKSWLFGTDPFMELYKVGESGEYRIVHRTEVQKRTLNPKWKPLTLPVRSLCGGDMDRTIKIACYDWRENGSHKLIGEIYVTLSDLSKGPGPHNVHHCINPKKQQNNPMYSHSGEIILMHYEYKKVYSFLDYILGGMQLHCTIAIDFTASNGDPQTPGSLHFISSPVPNQYMQALTAVGEIIQDYDSDRLFPVLGFGARMPDGRVSHEFFVNMHPQNPFCNGISGVLDAYKMCIGRIQLYGPTNFSPVINHVARFAEAYQDGSQYFILLIITDGVITDMQQTKQAIVRASGLPMSIIIVGVGGADFEAMDELDGDVVQLSYKGVKAQRDIVQFVPFRNFQSHRDIVAAKAYLAKEVLAEIPDQVVGYMKSRNIRPRQVPALPDSVS
ncbi:copine-8-like isoform X2 [Periplaneta americana]